MCLSRESSGTSGEIPRYVYERPCVLFTFQLTFWDYSNIDMLEYVKSMIRFANAHLTIEERSLLSVAYKNLTGNLRNSWRILSHLEETEGKKASRKQLTLVQSEKLRIEGEIANLCQDALELLAKTLIPAARPGDESVFYYKMYVMLPASYAHLLSHERHRRGDYYRYLAELARDGRRNEYASASLDAYKRAYKLALSTLEATHPTRLGLALNFAVYYRDVLNSPERACHLAKHAFDEAVAVLDHMPESTYRDSLLILQLLRDDLMLWFKEIQERGGFIFRF